MAVRAETGAPARALVRAVPVWAWLTAIVAVSAVARFVFAIRIEAPWIMVDELIYSELAKGLAAGDGFSIRGVADERVRVRLPAADRAGVSRSSTRSRTPTRR